MGVDPRPSSLPWPPGRPKSTRPQNPTSLPRFVLFDFGSARNIDLINDRKITEFETTYQYLPAFVKRRKPLEEYTSHNKVQVKFSWLEPEHVC